MNKRILIIAGVLIVLIIVITVLFSQDNNINTTVNTTPSPEPVSYVTEPPASDQNQTYKQFLSSGKSEICTFSTNIDNSFTNGTIYAALGKIRADITYTGPKGSIQQHLLVDAYETYMWNNAGNQGIKFPVTDKAPEDPIAALPNKSCSPWVANTAVFEIPATIIFTEITGLQLPNVTPENSPAQ